MAAWGAIASGRQTALRRTVSKSVLAVSALLVCALCVHRLTASTHGEDAASADVKSSVGLFGGVAAYEAAAGVLKTAGSTGAKIEKFTDMIETTNFTDIYSQVDAVVNLTRVLKTLKGWQLKRQNGMRDGNPCPDDEEVLAGLCYQKCSTLTDGIFPIRTSAFSCCNKEPCTFFNSKFSSPMKFCQGMDVGGHNKYGCPHAPGDCLLNEEFHLGFCYKSCLALTDGEYPYRSTADTCCKMANYLECLEEENYIASTNFSVGGGFGDDVLQEEMGQVHPPIPALAEDQPESTLPTLPAP